MTLYLIAAHLCRDSGLFDGEHATEPTALVRALWLNDINAVNELQQILNLVKRGHMLLAGRREPQLTDTVTRVVQRNLVWERAQSVAHLYYVVQKFDNIHALLSGFTLVLSVLSGFAAQQPRIVDLDERRTRHAGCYHVVEVLELLLKLLGQGNGLLLESGIGHWLTAAGLFFRIRHIQSQVLQQLPCCHTHLRVDDIHVTGNK